MRHELSTNQNHLKDYQKSIHTWEYLISYLSPGHKELGDCYFGLGVSYYELNNIEEFILQNEKARDAYALAFGRSDIKYTKTLNSLGLGYKFNGEYKRAEKVLIDAKSIKEKSGISDIQYGRILNQLSLILV